MKGDLFGELSLDPDKNANEYAKALTDEVSICSFLMSDFENLLLKHPNLALSYTKFVGLKMKRIRNNYSNLISHDAKSRLVTFLKEWAEKEGEFSEKKVTLENYLTQNDIAQIICTSRQTATQLLNEMEAGELSNTSERKLSFPISQDYKIYRKCKPADILVAATHLALLKLILHYEKTYFSFSNCIICFRKDLRAKSCQTHRKF